LTFSDLERVLMRNTFSEDLGAFRIINIFEISGAAFCKFESFGGIVDDSLEIFEIVDVLSDHFNICIETIFWLFIQSFSK